MTQSLTDLFGANASESGTTITIDLNDFVDDQNNALLASPETANAEQKASAWIAWLHLATTPSIDANGTAIVDKTKAIVAQSSFAPKTFETREDEPQIKNEFVFAIYTTDSTSFDPDNVV